jgi:hypothetical protein
MVVLCNLFMNFLCKMENHTKMEILLKYLLHFKAVYIGFFNEMYFYMTTKIIEYFYFWQPFYTYYFLLDSVRTIHFFQKIMLFFSKQKVYRHGVEV